MDTDNRRLLEEGLGALGLSLPAARVDALVDYHDRLLATCEAGLNLTGIRDERESVTRNLLDSLAPWRLLDVADAAPGSLTLAEVGAGGGLPGLPLAVVLPESVREVVLVESKEKKAAFLREAVAQLADVIAPRRVRVDRADANTLGETFDRLVFRAFAALPKIVRISQRLLAPGGRAVAWKGRRDRIDEELDDVPVAWRQAARVEAVTVPGLPADEERHAVILTRP